MKEIKEIEEKGEHQQEHTHVLADGTVISHTHGHHHSHTQTKAVLNRMARLIGHLESIKHMIEDGRDCSEVLVQLSAVDSAIKGVSRIILKDHLEHCIVDAVKDNDQQALEQLNEAIDRFIK
ncbi:metal-sensing transcriptional repressor [uncultured Mitsuokella sp.]|uniref:metal-sensing transcriptional repressor n=1 Tax=uncultured Mitsuokella sp. TaxID=453120 RepID=UPI0025CEA20D|nr:metal-sensing transcriptional repressor [uncultured Mitsuokella sp.]